VNKIYVVSPNHRATGGVELLHQFVDVANKDSSVAKVVYFPFNKLHIQPDVYKNYKCPQALVDEVDDVGAVVIVPETLTHLIRCFKKASIFIWWLSVDNYFGSQKLRFLVANRLLPFTHWKLRADRSVHHLAQSQYAIDFLAGNGVHGASLLTDYLNPDFIDAARRVDVSGKRDIVLYNPAKGMERTSQILNLLPSHIQAIPLQGMTRSQMVETLATAKAYIDFGNHPGKDRIPREAAIMRCCVLTNRRGSAANDLDVPILARHKIDDTMAGFAAEAARQVITLVEDYHLVQADYEPYRQMIQSEQGVFAAQVNKIVSETTSGYV
jgi:hypothetical protein